MGNIVNFREIFLLKLVLKFVKYYTLESSLKYLYNQVLQYYWQQTGLGGERVHSISSSEREMHRQFRILVQIIKVE